MYKNIILLGDMGSGYTEQHEVAKLIERIIKKKSKNLICGLGDNIYEDGCKTINDIKFKTNFEDPYKNISDKNKFHMCLGNHDYHSNYKAQIQYGILSSKLGKKWVMPHNYYTYSANNIDFFVIDTNIEHMTDLLIIKQYNKIKQYMNKSKNKWKIMYGHHPLRSIGGHGNARKKLEQMIKGLISYGNVDIYMSGHDHSKQLIKMNINNRDVYQIICGTGGKPGDPYINMNNMRDSELLFFSNIIGVCNIRSIDNNLILDFLNTKIKEFSYNFKK